MITAVEALRLPQAQLTAEERTEVKQAFREIVREIRKSMSARGIVLQTPPRSMNVVGVLSQMLRKIDLQSQWTPIQTPSRIQGGRLETIGFTLALVPSDAAYAAAYGDDLSTLVAEAQAEDAAEGEGEPA